MKRGVLAFIASGASRAAAQVAPRPPSIVLVDAGLDARERQQHGRPTASRAADAGEQRPCGAEAPLLQLDLAHHRANARRARLQLVRTSSPSGLAIASRGSAAA